jgi:hypothetical protein
MNPKSNSNNSFASNHENISSPIMQSSYHYAMHNDPKAKTPSTGFTLKNQSRSCNNLSQIQNGANFKTPMTNQSKNSSNVINQPISSVGSFFTSKFKGIKKGVDKLYKNNTKKQHHNSESIHNDNISLSNYSLNSNNNYNNNHNNNNNTNTTTPSTPISPSSIRSNFANHHITSPEMTTQASIIDSLNDNTSNNNAESSLATGLLLVNNTLYSQSKSLQETVPKSPNLSKSNNSAVKLLNTSKYSQASNYSIDKQDHIELNKKLALLSLKDRIWLQKRGFEILLQEAESKKAQIVTMKADIDELNKYLVSRKEPVRSQFEVETLRGENRELVNEKCKLEKEICKIKNKWECKSCTYSNGSEAVQCIMCLHEKDVNEILLCNHCGCKNSLFTQSCQKCNAYFASDLPATTSSNCSSYNNEPENISQRERRSSSNLSTTSNPRPRNSSSMSSSSSLNSFNNNNNSQNLNQSTSNGNSLFLQASTLPPLPPQRRSPRIHLNLATNNHNYLSLSDMPPPPQQPPPYSRSNTTPTSTPSSNNTGHSVSSN